MTGERTSLRHDAAWAMTGGLTQTAYQASIMLALARLAPAQVVGQYALGLALAAPLSVFADRAVRMLQATASDADFPLRDYLAVRTLVGMGAIVISALIVLAGNWGRATGVIVLLVAMGRLVEGLVQTLYGRLQRRHRMRQIGQSQAIHAALATGASLVCLMVWKRLDIALVASILANLAVLYVLDQPLVHKIDGSSIELDAKFTWSRRVTLWGHMIRLALPLAMATFLVSLSTNLPRLALSHTDDESTLGVFAVLCYLCLPATMAVSALMQAATPRLAECYRTDLRGRFQRLVRQLTLLCAVIAIFNGMLIHGGGPAILRVALSDEYVVSVAQLDSIAAAVGVGFIATVSATALNAQRMFGASLVTCLVSCATAFIASALFVPQFGITGAAGAMLLSSGVHGLVSWVALRTDRANATVKSKTIDRVVIESFRPEGLPSPPALTSRQHVA